MLLGVLEVWFLIKLVLLEDRGLQRLFILPSSIAMHLVRHLGGHSLTTFDKILDFFDHLTYPGLTFLKEYLSCYQRKSAFTVPSTYLILSTLFVNALLP